MENKTEIIAKLKKYIHTVYIVLQYILVGKHYKKNSDTPFALEFNNMPVMYL